MKLVSVDARLELLALHGVHLLSCWGVRDLGSSSQTKFTTAVLIPPSHYALRGMWALLRLLLVHDLLLQDAVGQSEPFLLQARPGHQQESNWGWEDNS